MGLQYICNKAVHTVPSACMGYPSNIPHVALQDSLLCITSQLHGAHDIAVLAIFCHSTYLTVCSGGVGWSAAFCSSPMHLVSSLTPAGFSAANVMLLSKASVVGDTHSQEVDILCAQHCQAGVHLRTSRVVTSTSSVNQ